MASATDESACKRCGGCCHKKFAVAGVVIDTSLPCRFLDRKTKLCTVYEQRHERNPECLSVEEGIKRGVFPASCPYVQDVVGYVAPEEMRDDGTLVGFVIRVGRLLLRAQRRA